MTGPAASPAVQQAQQQMSAALDLGSASGLRQRSEPQPVLRLNWLLRVPQPYEDLYWGSPEVQLSLMRLDWWGHCMSLMGLGSLTRLLHARAAAISRPVHIGSCCVLALSLLQLYLIQSRPALYKTVRHQLAYGHRLGRLFLLLLPVLRGRRDVVSPVMPKSMAAQEATAGALLAYVCFLPLCQIYTSLCFILPATATLLLQAAAAWLNAVLASQAHSPLGAIPGMQQLADNVCTAVRGVLELVLHGVVDQGTLPGVPAAGFDAFGLPSRCMGDSTFKQLLLYANLSLTYFIPVYVTYMVELHHKRQFWKVRGVTVTTQASPLVPVPGHYFISHCLVMCTAQLLLWFLAEAVHPLLA